MGCGCSSMKGFGAFGEAAAKAQFYYDLNPRGQVRVLDKGTTVYANMTLAGSNPKLFGGFWMAPKDEGPFSGSPVMFVPADQTAPAGLVRAVDWMAAQIKAGKKIAIGSMTGGDLVLNEDVFKKGAVVIVAVSDEEIVAGPNANGNAAIGDNWGYTPWDADMLRAWQEKQAQGGGSGASTASIWSGPVPWLIGGAIVLGVGAFALSKKKG